MSTSRESQRARARTLPDVNFQDKLLFAARVAVEAHDGQRRKAADVPYVLHPFRVAQLVGRVTLPLGVQREVCLLAALLHDVLENCSDRYSGQDMERDFGPLVTGVVLELTQDKELPKGERRKAMLEHCKHMSPAAKAVKLADRLDNMREMESLGPEFIARYCFEARILLEQMKGLCPELETEILKLIRKHHP